ncbi:MAG: hypothetical protein FWE03_06820 [Firmicutes bacterium]|nr:hypothetical protein [Bacillota bacterium]
MKLDKLLEYQKLDIGLRRITLELEKSDDAKKIEVAKQEFAIAKKAIEDSEKNALSLVEFFGELEKNYQEVGKKIDKLIDQIEKQEKELEKKPDKTSEFEKSINELAALKSEAASIENKIADQKSKGDETIQKYKAASDRAKKVRDFHAKAKERLDILQKTKDPEIKAIKTSLKKLEPQIDEIFMTQYKTITSEGKYPAFVEAHLDGKNFSCKGCGMSLSQTGSSALISQSYTSCESCRRIVYTLGKIASN